MTRDTSKQNAGPASPPLGRRGFLARIAAAAGGAALLGRLPRAAEAAPTSTLNSDPWVGEIALVAFTFAPRGWALCNGQLLAISTNQALFSLIGTIYGGDGRSTFALPDLRGRAPIHTGQGPGLADRFIGESSGSEAVTLTSAQLAPHSHAAMVSSLNGTSDSPVGAVPARSASGTPGYAAAPDSAMLASAIGAAGGGLAHDNMPPYLAMNYVIALVGIFPAQ